MNGCVWHRVKGLPWINFYHCTLDTPEKQLGCAHFHVDGTRELCCHNPEGTDWCTSATAKRAAEEAAEEVPDADPE